MKIILTLFFGFLSFLAYSQDNMIIDLNEYLEMFHTKNFENAEKFFYPELLDKSDKKVLINKLESSFSNKKDVEIIVSNSKINNISEKHLVENKNYYIINYSNNLNFHFVDKNISIPDMISAFNSTYGKGNVYYDYDLQQFTVLVSKVLIARSENGIDNWKFIVFSGSNSVIDLILPKEIVKKIL